LSLPSKYFIPLLFYLQVIVIHGDANAQSPYYYTLNEENGLPSSEVYQVLQDTFGFIWIGCEDGLYRYDGAVFKHYKNKNQNGKGKSGLVLDKNGKLWCQNFNGQIFNVSGDSLIVFKDFSNHYRTNPNFVIDNGNHIWICSENEIVQYHVNGKKLRKLQAKDQKGDMIIWNEIAINKKGELFASADKKGIARLIIEGTEVKTDWLLNNTTNYRYYIMRADLDYLIIKEENVNSSQNTLLELNLKNHRILKYHYPDNLSLYKINEDSSHQLWLCTSDGAYPLNRSKLKVSDELKLMSGDKISFYLEDRNGNTWLSSLQNGIHVIRNKKIITYTKENSLLTDNYVSALCLQNSNSLLIGTYSGSLFSLNEAGKLNHSNLAGTGNKYRQVKKLCHIKAATSYREATLVISKTILKHF